MLSQINYFNSKKCNTPNDIYVPSKILAFQNSLRNYQIPQNKPEIKYSQYYDYHHRNCQKSLSNNDRINHFKMIRKQYCQRSRQKIRLIHRKNKGDGNKKFLMIEHKNTAVSEQQQNQSTKKLLQHQDCTQLDQKTLKMNFQNLLVSDSTLNLSKQEQKNQNVMLPKLEDDHLVVQIKDKNQKQKDGRKFYRISLRYMDKLKTKFHGNINKMVQQLLQKKPYLTQLREQLVELMMKKHSQKKKQREHCIRFQ